MFTVNELLGWIILIIYALIIFYNISNLIYSKRCCQHLILQSCEKSRSRRILSCVRFFSVSGIILSSLYIVLQVDWILSDYASEIGGAIDLLWLLFEYMVAITLFALSLVTNIVVKWDEHVE